MFLLGDFNIDLLKIIEKSVFKEYVDHMLSFGLSPSITLPTRIIDTIATLIDNIFTNNNNSNTNNVTGRLTPKSEMINIHLLTPVKFP